MADDKSKKGFQDRTKINMEEPHEVAYWTERFKVNKQQLAEAVKAVGSSVKKVEESLMQHNRK